jgi:hypothetical protein
LLYTRPCMLILAEFGIFNNDPSEVNLNTLNDSPSHADRNSVVSLNLPIKMYSLTILATCRSIPRI